MCERLNINVAAPGNTYRAIGLRVAATGLITADSDGVQRRDRAAALDEVRPSPRATALHPGVYQGHERH